MRGWLRICATMAVLLGVAYPSHAFHSGGVAACEGCHTMHNSLGGTAVTTRFPAGTTGPYLLIGTDQSSVCLNCHEGQTPGGSTEYHVSTTDTALAEQSPPLQLTPGGDFAWLKKTYSWTGGVSKGDRHGHNIVAADYGYVVDSTISSSPGGNYPSDKLACSSCHDPHGRFRILTNTALGDVATSGKPIKGSGSYGTLPDTGSAVGVYRLLGGKGYYPKSVGSARAFAYPGMSNSIGAMFAVSPQDYNRSEASSDTRVSYGRYVADWCANCHEAMHTDHGTVIHPAGETLGVFIAPTYNAYKKSGDMTGNKATAYTSLVPFSIDHMADLTVLASKVPSTEGPISSDRVMCLSCHRAHASGWDSIGRWNFKTTFMVYDGTWPGGNSPVEYAQGRSEAETRQAYYDRPASQFATYQRPLCNKCHAKD